MSEFISSCIISLQYRFLKFWFSLIPQNSLFKAFLSKAASRLAISLSSAQDSAPYVATGLINVL